MLWDCLLLCSNFTELLKSIEPPFVLYDFITKEKGFTIFCKALIVSIENIGFEPMTAFYNIEHFSKYSLLEGA